MKFAVSPIEIWASLVRNRELILSSIRREVLGRYRGSVIGILWSLFNPLLMLAVYTFVFSFVFKTRWGGENDSKAEFALILFAGMTVFNMFAECINKAPGLIVNNQNYVKKVVFPLEILPWVSIGAALFHCAISFLVWLVAYLFLFGFPSLTVFYLPLVLLPLIMLCMGVSWGLASLGAYLRDVSQFVGILTNVLMFLSPIFYPVSALPSEFRGILFLNPITPAVELTRQVLFWGKTPDFFTLLVNLLVTAVIAWLGFVWFQKTRKGFADVL